MATMGAVGPSLGSSLRVSMVDQVLALLPPSGALLSETLRVGLLIDHQPDHSEGSASSATTTKLVSVATLDVLPAGERSPGDYFR